MSVLSDVPNHWFPGGHQMKMFALIVLTLVSSAYAKTKHYTGFSLNDSLECHKPGWPPMSEADLRTKFYMYTPSHRDGVIVKSGDMDEINAYGFDPNKQTHFFTHGCNSNFQSFAFLDIYNAFVEVEDANVFAVDWRRGAKLLRYNNARQNARVVGNQIAIFAKALGQSFTEIDLAGHSVGAHASGYAGEALAKDGITVNRITGLDPAGPGFSDQTDGRCRLDTSDAGFVDNIHTDGDLYGSATDMGHVDFYPNGGAKQPGCIIDLFSCSHGRAVRLYAESITTTTCKFTSFECDFWGDYESGKCTSCGGIGGCCNFMGYWANRSCLGRRYVATNGKYQYCKS